MCRKGRMFAPLKIWRRWHRRTNLKQKRFAVATALAATAILPLVQARGHRVDQVPEFPLVVDNSVEDIEKTSKAVEFLKDIGAFGDVKKVANTLKLRAGRGKIRNRRYRTRKGPLVVHSGVNVPLLRALRNIPGVETVHVSRLNLLQLAPGGHVGRFCIWTESAFKKLDSLYGTWRVASKEKSRWNLPQPKMAVTDLSKLLKAEEIRQVLRKPNKGVKRAVVKTNPLKNIRTMLQLNPYAAVTKRAAELPKPAPKKK